MAAKIVPPAATPAREGRERALVQNQTAEVNVNALPLRGSRKDASRPAIFAGGRKEGPEFSKNFTKRDGSAVSQRAVLDGDKLGELDEDEKYDL